MWDMLNGGRNYEKKMKELKKLFGMKERSIQDYYNIYKLSKHINLRHQDAVKKIDTQNMINSSKIIMGTLGIKV